MSLLNALNEARAPAAALDLVKQEAAKGNACRYAEVATKVALDADLHADALQLLDTVPKDCASPLKFSGLRAEALARAGMSDQSEQVAQEVLKGDASNSYAEWALARVASDRGQMTACGRHAEKALQLGRGIEADRLLGRSTLAQGQFKDAEAHFQRVLLESPNDVEASFSAGVCNDKLGRYHQAREAFLQTLQANPKHAEARRYLVLLANRAGAKDEARHHLRKLAELVPKGSDVISDLDELISGGAAGASGGAKTN